MKEFCLQNKAFFAGKQKKRGKNQTHKSVETIGVVAPLEKEETTNDRRKEFKSGARAAEGRREKSFPLRPLRNR